MRNALIKNKSFVSYLTGQVISSIGDGFYLIGFMWLALHLSAGRGIVLGGVFSIYTLGEITFGFIAGPVVDRINRKTILIIIDVVRGLIVFLLFMLVKLQIATVLHLYIITFAFSVFSPFFHRAEFAIIPQLVEKDLLLSANGLLSGSKRLMQVIAPGLGGVFIAIFGIAGCFLFDALSFFFSTIFISLIKISAIEVTKKGLSIKFLLSDWKMGYRFLTGSTFLLTIAIYAASINFFGGPVFPLLPLLSQKNNMGATGYGMMMSSISIGFIITSLFIGVVDKFLKKIPMVLIGLFISASAIMLMAIGQSTFPLIIASVMMGLGMNFSNLPILTLFQEKVPKDKLGVVSSFVFTISQIAMPISMALSGLLVDIFSVKEIFICISLILFFGGMIGFYLPALKKEEIVSESANLGSTI